MSFRPARFATTIALAGILLLPNATMAGEPPSSAPPAPVVTWQQHLDHMRMMGPNGMMVGGMADMMGEARP